jgi:putative DNA methylase
MSVISPKKLIEVALPLDAINAAAAREKSIRHGHPSTLHLWWARRPLAAARAVIFAQLVHDPEDLWRCQNPGVEPNKQHKGHWTKRRAELFQLIEQLVLWKNTTDDKVLNQAREEIRTAWKQTCELNKNHPDAATLFNPEKMPGLHDPFAGGGAIPLEAQRLGLEAYASDLNPVAVLINKAMIEIPPKFAGRPPVWSKEQEGKRKEGSHALPGTDRLAKGDGDGSRGVPSRADAPQRGNLRDAVADHPGSRVDSGQHRGGLGAGIDQGEGSVSGDLSGVARGDGNALDALRTDRMVSARRDSTPAKRARRSQPNSHDTSSQDAFRVSASLFPLSSQLFPGASGLAKDVRFYGQWMRDEAFKRIGHLYPPIEITPEMVQERPDLKPYEGEKLTVIAWLWARTVKSPNPAFSHIDVPLASTFILSSKEGKEAYVQPVIDKNGYRFTVKVGKPPAEAKAGTTAGKRAAFICLMSNVPMSYDYIREQGQTVGLGQKLMAIVAEGTRGRVYLTPTAEQEAVAAAARPEWKPDNKLPDNPRDFKTPNYGMMTFGDLFTPRQLVALTTFSDLVGEARERIRRDAVAAGLKDDDTPLDAGGTGARAYAEAVSVYLGVAVARYTNAASTICSWNPGEKKEDIRFTFSRQALPMTWDFAEGSPFSDSSGNFADNFEIWLYKTLLFFAVGIIGGRAVQSDAQTQSISARQFISTDPPYYDNIGYADLSDFFYVWLRRSLRSVFPNLLSTIAVPKAEELVATPYRHGTKQKAEKFFLDGMTQAMHNLAVQAHPAAPITIYYAFKQSETETTEGTSSSGWETFLDAVLKSGLSITGTWPMRTERAARSVSQGTNALASSIILVCRPRAKDAGTIDRRKFQRLLNEALPLALDAMTRSEEREERKEKRGEDSSLFSLSSSLSPVSPVDLSQAIIGPGMAIFSRYEAVLEANGTPMTVKTALQLINRFLAEDDFDADTQFCLHWFEQHGWDAGKFGEADTLARAKGTSVDGVRQAGVIQSGGGHVRLFRWRELDPAWDPAKDPRIPVWQVLHQMILSCKTDGESGAGRIYGHPKCVAQTEAARQLAYRLYTLCERKGWAEDARAYNEVVTGWSGIESAAAKEPQPKQGTLFDNAGETS